MIKELFQLIRMLFMGNPKKCGELGIVKMKHFPFPGYLAMSWAGHIITREPERIDEVTVNHETIHLNQAKRFRSWVSFYLSYFWQWIKSGGLLFRKSAYYTIPYEVEAYANEDNPSYCNPYNPGLLKTKYTLKNRDWQYKVAGGIPVLWKRYIKTL